MSKYFKFVTFNGKYYMVDKQDVHKELQKRFCDIKGHDFSTSDSPTIDAPPMEELGSDANDIHQTCNVCGFGVIYWKYTKEDMLAELYQSTFREKYEEAEKGNKVVVWEYLPRNPCSSLLCSILGHNFDLQQTYVDSKGNETWLDIEDNLDRTRLADIRNLCDICGFRRIEIYPDNKKFMKNKNKFN